MNSSILISIIFILILSSVARWLGWRFKIPSILILLLTGFIVGPILDIFNPDEIFGESLFPLVSAAVAIILFEGGLTLKFRDLKESGPVIFRLVFIGVAVTTLVAAYLANTLLGFEPMLAALFGALLSVTGPTVIGPMLRMIRPKGKVKNIAKWEGILIDPVGVLLAVLIYEVMIHENASHAQEILLLGITKTLIISCIIAGLTTTFFIYLVKSRQIPEFLHNLFVLALILTSFEVSNLLQEESGLLTVTLMGIIFANQRVFPVTHILHFKENLRVLLISTLFIVLAARVDANAFKLLSFESFIFLILLIIFVRPAAVILSTIGSKTTWKERALLMMLAPRGIVAVALTSVFVLKLSEIGIEQAEEFFAVMLLVIVGTVLFYGLMAGKCATKLELSKIKPNGILIIGAHSWAIRIAKILQDIGVYVCLIDTNRFNISKAKADKIPAHCGNVLSDEFLESIDLSEIGHAICLTPNNEVNAFAQTTLIEFIERSHIHYLMPESFDERDVEHAKPLNPLFKKDINFSYFNNQLRNGSKFDFMIIEEEISVNDLINKLDKKILPLFLINKDNTVEIFTEKDTFELLVESKMVYLEITKSPKTQI